MKNNENSHQTPGSLTIEKKFVEFEKFRCYFLYWIFPTDLNIFLLMCFWTKIPSKIDGIFSKGGNVRLLRPWFK